MVDLAKRSTGICECLWLALVLDKPPLHMHVSDTYKEQSCVYYYINDLCGSGLIVGLRHNKIARVIHLRRTICPLFESMEFLGLARLYEV